MARHRKLSGLDLARIDDWVRRRKPMSMAARLLKVSLGTCYAAKNRRLAYEQRP